MRPNLYQAARMLTTAGVTADIQFHPTAVTNRLRKSIQRQVESGDITGGYSSHAARLAKALCEQFKLPYIRGDYWGLRVQFTSEEARKEATALIKADFAAYMLTQAGNDHHTWVQRSRDRVQQDIDAILAGDTSHLRFYSDKMYMQMMRELFIKHRTPSDIFNAKQVSNMLNQDSPIRINQHNWND